MNLYISEPWKRKTFFNKYASAFLVFVFFLSIMLSYATMLSSQKASADDQGVCENFVIAGDINGVGIKDADIGKKLKDKGAKNVSFYVHEGRRTQEVTDALKNVDPRGNCFIIESGSGNIPEKDSEQNVKEIRKLKEKLQGAKKVYWITPVFSGERSDLDGGTKEFQRNLSDEIGKEPNYNIVNIQQFALHDDLFDEKVTEDGDPRPGNKMAMTTSGYSQRSNAIVDAVEKDIAKVLPENENQQESQQENQQENQQAPPPPERTNGSNALEGTAPQNMSPQIRDATTPDGGTPPPKDFKPDEFSPAAFANAAQESIDDDIAYRYLATGRWGSPVIPRINLNPLNGSISKSTTASITSWAFGFAHIIYVAIFWLANNFISGGTLSASLTIGDYFYGKYFGFAGGQNVTSVSLISSIMTIAIMLAAWRAVSPANRLGAQQRINGFFTSIMKVSFVMALAVVSGTASRNNAGDGGFNQTVGQANEENRLKLIEKIGGGDSSVGENALEENAVNSGTLLETTVEKSSGAGGNPDILKPLSWKPMSMGFFVSFIYEAGRIFASAVITIIFSVIVGPLESLNLALQNIVSQGNKDERAQFPGSYSNEGGIGDQCSRYVDSMHYVFMNSGAMSGNPSAARAIRSMDAVYARSVMPLVEVAQGGMTSSGTRSWCWEQDVASDIPAGDWGMVSRGAGNYGAALGVGNLIDKSNAISSGKPSPFSATNTLVSASQSQANGILVDINGNWNPNDSGGAKRLEAFMGINRGRPGYDAARFYHGACLFKPGTTEAPKISSEWRNVVAMTWDENAKTSTITGEEKAKWQEVIDKYINNAPGGKGVSLGELNKEDEGSEGSGDSGGEDSDSGDSGGEDSDSSNGDSEKDGEINENLNVAGIVDLQWLNVVDNNKFLTDEDCLGPLVASSISFELPSNEGSPTGLYGGFGHISQADVGGEEVISEAPYTARWNFGESEKDGLLERLQESIENAGKEVKNMLADEFPGMSNALTLGQKVMEAPGKTWDATKRLGGEALENLGIKESEPDTEGGSEDSGPNMKNDGMKKGQASNKFSINETSKSDSGITGGAKKFFDAKRLERNQNTLAIFSWITAPIIAIAYLLIIAPIVLLGAILSIFSFFFFLLIGAVVGFLLIRYAMFGGSRNII